MPVLLTAHHREPALELGPLVVRLEGDRVDDVLVQGEAELVVLEGAPVGPWGAEVLPELSEEPAGVWTVAAALLRLGWVLVSVDGVVLPPPPTPGPADAVY